MFQSNREKKIFGGMTIFEKTLLDDKSEYYLFGGKWGTELCF